MMLRILVLAVPTLFCLARVSDAQSPVPAAQDEFRRALDLAQHGQSANALELVDKLLKTNPGYVAGWKLKGSLLEDAGRGAEAGFAYEKGLKLSPSDPDLLYKVGVFQLVAGDRERATGLLERYVALQPRDGDGYFYLAQAYHLSKRDDRALAAIRACLKLKPNSATVWQKYGELLVSSGDGESGYAWLQKAYEANPHLDRIDYDLAVASFDRMDLQSAQQFAQKAASARPDDPEVLHLMASIDGKLSDWQGALILYQRILDANSNDSDALLGLGRCQLELKQYGKAVDTLTSYTTGNPANIQAHYYLSRAYAGAGDSAEAQHQADLHQKMVEQTSFASSALGSEQDRIAWPQARKLLEEGSEQKALALFRHDAKGNQISPGQPYFLVGALYLYLDRQADGLRNLKRALQLDPKLRGPRTYIGIAALQENKLEEAEREFNAEIANDPNYQTALAELGVVRYRQQRWADAADQLSRSHTQNPALLLSLCDAYFHLGKVKEANLTAELAAAYAKDDPAILDGLSDLLRRNGQTELALRLGGSIKN